MNTLKRQYVPPIATLIPGSHTISFAHEQLRNISWGDLMPAGIDPLTPDDTNNLTIDHDAPAAKQQRNWSAVIHEFHSQSLTLARHREPLEIENLAVIDFFAHSPLWRLHPCATTAAQPNGLSPRPRTCSTVSLRQ